MLKIKLILFSVSFSANEFFMFHKQKQNRKRFFPFYLSKLYYNCLVGSLDNSELMFVCICIEKLTSKSRNVLQLHLIRTTTKQQKKRMQENNKQFKTILSLFIIYTAQRTSNKCSLLNCAFKFN